MAGHVTNLATKLEDPTPIRSLYSFVKWKIDLGVSVLRMRDFAPLGTKWLGYFFWGVGVLEKGYSRDACTDFDAQYVKRRGSAQGSAFGGRETKI